MGLGFVGSVAAIIQVRLIRRSRKNTWAKMVEVNAEECTQIAFTVHFSALTSLGPLSSNQVPSDRREPDPTKSEPLSSIGVAPLAGTLREALGVTPSEGTPARSACWGYRGPRPPPFPRLRVLAVPWDWPGPPIAQPQGKNEWGVCAYNDEVATCFATLYSSSVPVVSNCEAKLRSATAPC